jgi:DNA (cytosine-5)-methyltransferase 1
MNYYNEINPFAAAWLRELVKAGHISKGEVDERSIEDVKPNDLKGYKQCHFFAGIGVWSYALRQAGWSDDREVWTGSCPCQPFSAAGKRGGTSDERHLWPAFFHLIQSCHPDVIFGEQVASKDGLAWFDIVSTDLEAKGYTVGAADLCAAGFGAPHIRQRLYFVADSTSERLERAAGSQLQGRRKGFADGGNSSAEGLQRSGEHRQQSQDSSVDSSVEHADYTGSQGRELRGTIEERNSFSELAVRTPSAVNGFWRAADWLPCVDGKSRPVESGTFPLAYGSPVRVGRLRGYGNAIVAPQAKAFIKAYLETK